MVQLDGMGWIENLWNLMGAINKIETLVVELQIGDNFIRVNWSFPILF